MELGQPTTFLISDFEGLPRILWRRSCGTPKQPEHTSWKEIDASVLLSAAGLSGDDAATVLSGVVDFAEPGLDGAAAKSGQVVQLALQDRVTLQTTGTSFVLGNVPRN